MTTLNVREAGSLEDPTPEERFMWGDTVDDPANLALLRLGYEKGREANGIDSYEDGYSFGRERGYDEGYNDGLVDGREEAAS